VSRIGPQERKGRADADGLARVNVLHGPVFGPTFECPDELSARGPLLVHIWSMSLQKKKKLSISIHLYLYLYISTNKL
jgi:hypothetical protein